jgi:diguanylate cyclase (GGDEF)-like protein
VTSKQESMRRLLAPAAAAAVCVFVALAGAALGPGAALLALPAALATVAVSARAERRATALLRASLQDPLTGVGNRRLLAERLEAELGRHRRHGRPLTVVVLDLDGFKHVNDRFGHPVGDEVLRDVAHALQRAVRSEDVVARAGGDEFWILAPETGTQGALQLVRRLERAVAHASAGLDDLGASLGWAVAPTDGDDAGALLAAADAAQVAAKRARRAQARAA